MRDTCCLPKPHHLLVRVAGMTFNFSAVQLDRPPASDPFIASNDAHRSPVRSRRAKFVAQAPTPQKYTQTR
ncbi:hypothetical protein [Granulicella sp. dw_53]|uniref:hypothetical protein n=1 Tax=Granulicella sp. dw_53 TaxID=2719792 RepID=UPI001BD3E836|nr:hypothetical protein [Granulicella sp. dw_53]